MKKKFLVTLLMLCMVFALIPATALAAEFSDMPDDYSTIALNNAVANGLLNGGDGKIMPDADLTRAQMAAIMVRALGANGTADLSSFDDVDLNAWYAQELGDAVKMELFQGDGASMRPNAPITRQEAFVVLARAFKMDAADLAVLDKYADKANIGDWAQTGLAAMVEAGFVQGDDMNNINPTANIKRKDFAVVIDRMIAQYITAAGIYSEVSEGSVLINTADVTLQNLTVAENLIIGDGVADGDVTLDNVTVGGELIVRGGGINSIIIKGDSNIGIVKVVKIDGEIRIVVEEGAVVDIVYVNDGEDDIIIEGKINKLIVADDVPLKINDATIETVSIEAVNADITLGEGTTVTTLDVTEDADDTSVKVEDGAEVETLNAAGAGTSVSGAGEVGTVEVTGNDVEVDTEGTTVKVGEGVTGTEAGGEAVEGGATVETPGTTSGTGGGSSGGGSTPVTYKYNVSLPAVTGGKIMADITQTNTANTGVTLTVAADEGYVLHSIKVIAPDGDEISFLNRVAGYFFLMEDEGTYTVTAEFIKPLESLELFVVHDKASHDKLSAINGTNWPSDAEYVTNGILANDPWLGLIIDRNDIYDDVDADKLDVSAITFYKNGAKINPDPGLSGKMSSAMSIYIGSDASSRPEDKKSASDLQQTTLSGTYKVEFIYKGIIYTDEVTYQHDGENTYNVTFSVPAGHTAPSPQIIKSGETANTPAFTLASGYYLVDWYKDAAYTNKWDFRTDTVTAETTIYAKVASTTVMSESELQQAITAGVKDITVGANITITDDLTVPDTATLTISNIAALTIASNKFTNNGFVISEAGGRLIAEQNAVLAGNGTFNLSGSTTVYSFQTFMGKSATFNMIGEDAKLLLSIYADQNDGAPFEHLGSNGLIKLDADATLKLYEAEYTLESGTATFKTSAIENTFTVGSGATLVIDFGATLTVKDGASLELEEGATLRNHGTLAGNPPTGPGKVITVVDNAAALDAALNNNEVDNIEVNNAISLDSDTYPNAYRIERELTISGGTHSGSITHGGSLDGEAGVVYMFAVRGADGHLTLNNLSLTVEAGVDKGTVVSVEKAGQLTIDGCSLTVNDSTDPGISNGVFVQGYDPVKGSEYAKPDTHAGAVKITNTKFDIEGANATAIGSQILNVADFNDIFAADSLSGNNYANAYVFRQNDHVPVQEMLPSEWDTQSAELFDAQFALLQDGQKMARYTLHTYARDEASIFNPISTFDVFSKTTASSYDVEMSYIEDGDFVVAMESVRAETAYTKADSVSLTLSEKVTIPSGALVIIPANTTVNDTIEGTDSTSALTILSGGTCGDLAAGSYTWDTVTSKWKTAVVQ